MDLDAVELVLVAVVTRVRRDHAQIGRRYAFRNLSAHLAGRDLKQREGTAVELTRRVWLAQDLDLPDHLRTAACIAAPERHLANAVVFQRRDVALPDV